MTRAEMAAKLRTLVAKRTAERGRSLTPTEQLANLEAALDFAPGRIMGKQLSHFALAVMGQLKRTPEVFDGDLVSKTGRDELVRFGLARRERKFASGPYRGCQINELTSAGRSQAARLIDHEPTTRN